MNRIPRLLPLLAVAVVGVLAINLLAGAGGFPRALQGARAWAEELATGAPPATAAPNLQTATPTAVPSLGATVAAAAAANPGVCAPTAAELAAAADLSPNELMALQRLGERDGELNTIAGDIDTQMQLLAAAEGKVEARIAVLRELTVQLQGLLGQVDQQQAAETARLVKVYETMRPREAAQALATMADDVRLPIMAAMKEAKLSAIFNEMTKRDAAVTRDVTEKLSRYRAGALAVNEARMAAAVGTAAASGVAATPPAAGQAAAPAAPGRGGATPPAPGRGGASPAPGRSAANSPAAPAARPAPAPAPRTTPAPAPKTTPAPAPKSTPAPATKTAANTPVRPAPSLAPTPAPTTPAPRPVPAPSAPTNPTPPAVGAVTPPAQAPSG